MKFKIFILSIVFLLITACGVGTNNSMNSETGNPGQPIVTYVYDDGKEICLYSGDKATVDGQSGKWEEGVSEFLHSDGISVGATSREYIYVEYGSSKLVIWPGTRLVFFGQDNVNEGFKDPSNDRLGKRCYKKR